MRKDMGVVHLVVLVALAVLPSCSAVGPRGGPPECSLSQACTPPLVCNEGYCYAPVAADAGDLAAQASGCARGGGVQLGNDAWACAGPFPRNSGPALCASGFEVCKTADKVPQAACESVQGFFAAAATLFTTTFDQCTAIDASFVNCSSGTYQYRMGCGTSTLVAVFACEHACSGFRRAISCSRAKTSGYSCGGGPSPAGDQSDSPAFGVLCCRQ